MLVFFIVLVLSIYNIQTPTSCINSSIFLSLYRFIINNKKNLVYPSTSISFLSIVGNSISFSTVNLCEFYFWRLIVCLLLQELNFCKQTRTCSISHGFPWLWEPSPGPSHDKVFIFSVEFEGCCHVHCVTNLVRRKYSRHIDIRVVSLEGFHLLQQVKW